MYFTLRIYGHGYAIGKRRRHSRLQWSELVRDLVSVNSVYVCVARARFVSQYDFWYYLYFVAHHLSREASTAGHRPPQSSPRRSVLRRPHPAASRDLHQIVGPPCGGPTNAASSGTR
jgi:hypothetical protein